ncbi:MAG: hypothetical protein WBX49_07310, partial [Candidatus Deferrimicrobiaceae bacterium]
MSTSRDQILSRLRAVQPALGAIETVGEYLPVVPRGDSSGPGLLDQFVEQARQLACEVHLPASPAAAIQMILDVLGEERRLLSWAFVDIPLP